MRGADEVTNETIARALGEELRRAREARGWSRPDLTRRLPSGIGEQTLLTYEHGSRHCTFVRLVEICRILGVSTLDATSRNNRCLASKVTHYGEAVRAAD